MGLTWSAPASAVADFALRSEPVNGSQYLENEELTIY